MFFSTDLLTKRGPLARVWMASHLSTSTKLSKPLLLQTSIPSSVSSILGEALLPMALRLSGQLLLGVTRIYQRKAKYLLEDCNETLAKVKKAFQPGQVDLDDQAGGGEGINLRRGDGGVDDYLVSDNFNWDTDFNLPHNAALAGPTAPSTRRLANTAAQADITLAEHDGEGAAAYGQYAYGDDLYGDAVFDLGGGAVEEEFELGLFDDEPELGRKRARDEGDEAIELGRRASLAPSSAGGVGPFDLARGEGIEFDKGIPVRDGDFGGEEFRFDGTFDDFQVGDGGAGEREFTPINFDGSVTGDINLTPTAADERPAKKARRARHQPIDAVTELEGRQGRQGVHFRAPEFLPASRLVLRIDEIRSSMAYYTPAELGHGMRSFAPKGLHPSLQALFAIPSRAQRIVDEGRAAPAPAAGDADDVELGRRRHSSVFSQHSGFDAEAGGFGDDAFGGFDVHADAGAGFEGGLGGEDVRFGSFGPDEAELGFGRAEREATPRAAVRAESPDRDADGHKKAPFVTSGPLAVFAEAESSSQAASSTQARSLAADEESAPTEAGFHRFSRHTAKAIGIFQAQLAAADGGDVEFGQVARPAQVAKRDAAKFFFETLVLSTRGHLKVSQAEAYAPITISANESLFALGEEAQV